MDLIDALASDLPSTFHRDPAAVPAFTLYYHAPLAWTVTPTNRLQITLGETAHDIDLRAHTHASLAASLAGLGVSLAYTHPDLGPLTAATLLAGSGQVEPGSLTTLRAFTRLLWAWLRPLAHQLELSAASADAFQAQLNLPSARLHWADQWGRYFGVARREGESDPTYTQRIIAEVFRPRNTRIAIERGVAERFGVTLSLLEPWTWMFVVSGSRLSGRHALPGSYYQYHVLHPTSIQAVSWPTVLAEIDRLRPAGSIVWTPKNRLPPQSLLAEDWIVSVETHYGHLHQKPVSATGGILSDNLILSGDYVSFTLSPRQTHHRSAGDVRLFLETGDPTWNETTWDSRSWTTASQYATTSMIDAQHATRFEMPVTALALAAPTPTLTTGV